MKAPILTPAGILELGLGFWASKTLLSAIELGLFTDLAKEPLTWQQLAQRLGLHSRASRDFFDALVVLRMLNREGDRYTNTAEADFFLDRNKPTCAGGMLEMANARLYGFWGALTEALRSGQPQNEVRQGQNLFQAYVTFHSGDFSRDAIPTADVLVFGHILHDWSLDEKRMLSEKAYQALPDDGVIVVYEALIDDDRRENAFGLLMSLNMLIETPAGFDFTGADCSAWMRDAGFRQTRLEHLVDLIQW